MKLYKLLLATALVCALVIGASQAASSHSITLTWDLPVTTADMGDCLTAGYPIPEEKPIITRIQWRVLGTSTWNTADTFNRQNIYTLQNLPPETTYEIRVGSHYGAGTDIE